MGEFRVPTAGAVVVAVDGSDASRAALRWAGTLDATLRVVRAWAYPTTVPLPWSGTAPHTPDEVDREVLAHIERLVADELGARPGVEVAVLRGPAAGALIAHVQQTGAAEVVVGARGVGGFAGLLLGSVSRHLLGHASCRVTVVPGPDRAAPRTGISTIVVGIDGSPLSNRALDHAVALAQRTGAGIIATHAFHSGYVEIPPQVGAELREAAERRVLDQCGRQLALPVVKDCRLLDGDARRVLLEVAEAVDADLMVVGALGAGTIQQPLGPVAAHLGAHAPLPVTVVR